METKKEKDEGSGILISLPADWFRFIPSVLKLLIILSNSLFYLF